MADTSDIEIRMLSQARYVCIGRSAAEAAARAVGMDEQTAGQVKLAVGEALANVIHHGYNDCPDHPIWLKLSPYAHDGTGGLEVVIEDECGQVDLSTIKGRKLEDIRPGGLGVHLIQQVMDYVEYRQREGGCGLTLIMRKNLRHQPNQAAVGN